MDDAFRLQIGFKVRECVVITPKGRIDDPWPDGLGWITVDVQAFARKFEGTITDYLPLNDISTFCAQLEELYQTLQGKARLGTIDGRFNVDLKGDGLGHIAVTFDINDDLASLKFTIEIDQTLVPKMIAEVKHIIAFSTNP